MPEVDHAAIDNRHLMSGAIVLHQADRIAFLGFFDDRILQLAVCAAEDEGMRFWIFEAPEQSVHHNSLALTTTRRATEEHFIGVGGINIRCFGVGSYSIVNWDSATVLHLGSGGVNFLITPVGSPVPGVSGIYIRGRRARRGHSRHTPRGPADPVPGTHMHKKKKKTPSL